MSRADKKRGRKLGLRAYVLLRGGNHTDPQRDFAAQLMLESARFRGGGRHYIMCMHACYLMGVSTCTGKAL